MRNTILAMLFALLPLSLMAGRQSGPDGMEPDGTYMFTQRDTCDLYLDIYGPAPGSETMYNGKRKPTILFVFGGGFISGSRAENHNLPWYRELTENGYGVIAIDYRLGLKGVRSVGIAQVNVLDKAIHMAVEDLFSATGYIIDNSDALGVDPENIVTCGSSAGAITVLQADYELCNRTKYAAEMPSGFRYAGVMSFSGGILSRNGKLKYATAPAPTLLVHGTADKLVNYKQIKFFNIGFFGSDKIAGRFEKFGYCYTILRYKDCGHEIAAILDDTTEYQFEFLENTVMGGKREITDMTIEDPSIVKVGHQSRRELYGGN